MNRIYISGKISDLTKSEYTKNFLDAENEVYRRIIFREIDYLKGDFKIINPITIIPIFGIRKWLFFMITDLLWLKKCNVLAIQKNWTESRGAVIEYFFAKFIFKIKHYEWL